MKLRRQMQLELKHLQRNLGTTFICVTHDQEEAMTMADRIAVMRDGIVEQSGTPESIYNHPRTRFVANFMGESNFFTDCTTTRKDNMLHVGLDDGTVILSPIASSKADGSYLAGIRPEKMDISMEKRADKSVNSVSGRIEEICIKDYCKQGWLSKCISRRD